MLLSEILRFKGSLVHTIEPDATLGDVVQALVEHNIGALVVCQPREDGRPGRMLGIISERDILRACAASGSEFTQRGVSDVMTTNVITGRPNDTVTETMGVMTDHRIRHLPILDSHEELVGMISIGDLVKSEFHEAVAENHYLKSYIHG